MIQLLSLALVAASPQLVQQTGQRFPTPGRTVNPILQPIVPPIVAGAVQVQMVTAANATVNVPVQSATFDVENALNIGSGTSGAGAGKVVFNPLVLTRAFDANSVLFFESASSATHFSQLTLISANMKAIFKLVAVKSDSFTVQTDGSVIETVNLEYGSLALGVK